MKKLSLCILGLFSLQLLVALEFVEIGAYLPGSTPNGLEWTGETELALGSNLGIYFYDFSTGKSDIVLPNRLSIPGLVDERDRFSIITGNRSQDDQFYNSGTKELIPINEAIGRWKEGRLTFKYFKGYPGYDGQARTDTTHETITIRTRKFDDSYQEETYPIGGFESWVVWSKDGQLYYKPWSFKSGENKLNDFVRMRLHEETSDLPIYYSSISNIYKIVDINPFSGELIIESASLFYKVIIADDKAFLHIMLRRPKTEWPKESKRFTLFLLDNHLFSISPRSSLILYQDYKQGENEFEGMFHYPVAVRRDDGTISAQLWTCVIKNLQTDAALNWKRTRLALAGYNSEKNAMCVTVFAIIRDGVLNDSNVRIRSEPNTSAKVLGALMKGDIVKVHDVTNDKMVIGDTEAYWYRIKTPGGVEGWVYGAYVDLTD